MFTLYSKNCWFIHVLVRNEKKNLCFTKIGKHDPNVKWFSIFQWVWGMPLPESLTWLCQSTTSCMLRAILNKCTFEFILDGKITLLYQDNMF